MACGAACAADFLLPLEGRQQYAMTLSARGAELTGICVMKYDGEGYRGAVVNEFGIHALDFTLSSNRRKVKLLNVMPAMNRWYIRKVVRKDLQLLFSAAESPLVKGRRTVTTEADGTVVLTDGRYHLKYSLRKIEDQ